MTDNKVIFETSFNVREEYRNDIIAYANNEDQILEIYVTDLDDNNYKTIDGLHDNDVFTIHCKTIHVNSNNHNMVVSISLSNKKPYDDFSLLDELNEAIFECVEVYLPEINNENEQ